MSHDPTLMSEELSAATVFDPVAWERRVAEARARRKRALAGKRQQRAEPVVVDSPVTDPEAATDEDPGFVPAEGIRRRGLPLSRVALVFLAGIGLGLLITRGLSGPDTPAESATVPTIEAAAPQSTRPEPGEAATAAPVVRAEATPPATPAAPPPAAALAPEPTPLQPAVVHEAALILPADGNQAAPEHTATRLTLPEPVEDEVALPLEYSPPAPRQATAVEDLGPTVPVGTRIVVNAPRGLSRTELDDVLGAMRAAGVDIGATHRVDLAVDTTNLRYFFASDRDRAAAVAATRATGSTPPTLRDFSHLSPRPRPGTLELWLAGNPGPGAAAVIPTPTAPAPPDPAMDPARLRALVQTARGSAAP